MRQSKKHGDAFDRGSADSYYRRSYSPHYWPDGTGHGLKIETDQLSEEQILDYQAGWDDNEDNGDFKNWD